MSLLHSLATDPTIANERDSVGGTRVLESGMYTSNINLAYLTKSNGGALGLVLGLKTDAGQELRQTLWMTSGTAKGCKNFYEKDGQKTYLPGFLLANSICLLTVGKEISQIETEQKVVNAWSSEAKAEVPTKVDMLTDLLGQEIIAAVFKQIVDKTKKNETTGVYEPTGETKEENEIDKFFRARDKMTTAEIRGQASEPIFYGTWEAKWTGKTREKAKGAPAGSGTAGAPRSGPSFGTPAAAAAKKPTSSLFS